VQSHGAFDETLRGILNLKRAGVRVELRVVIQRSNFEQLPALAEFIARNLLFLDHVALMGIEPIGYAKANLGSVWIDPVDYQVQLKRAVRTLATARMQVSIYNHQLCTLERDLWSYAAQSISDWKNEYLDECGACAVKHKCGGFFSSGVPVHSRSIAALAS
jgi:His-Xaa-Ser system radical SAM maturase HxsC